ncbi:TPA: hypothetical protein O4G09_002595 [Klebsiella michiganensis]|nr:hypothetical protein [Klebsiella michiganensis]
MMRFHFLIPLLLLLAVGARSIADSQVYIWQRVWQDGLSLGSAPSIGKTSV